MGRFRAVLMVEWMGFFGGLYIEVKERKKSRMTPRFLCIWHVMGSLSRPHT